MKRRPRRLSSVAGISFPARRRLARARGVSPSLRCGKPLDLTWSSSQAKVFAPVTSRMRTQSPVHGRRRSPLLDRHRKQLGGLATAKK